MGFEMHMRTDTQWDDYWRSKEAPVGGLYDFIAVLYRKFIIKPSLDHFLRKYFQQGWRVLHAGCGSGQVDTDINRWLKITALDISTQALAIYKRNNPGIEEVVHGDIFALPFDDKSFDGVYNLGVMEHFTVEDIRKVLKELRRVLKPAGKIVLFWPPESGLSVVFLKMVHFILNDVLKRSVQLHPAEITRIQSRRHVKAICESAGGLEMLDYYFGPKDLFTQAVIVLGRRD